MTQEKIVTEFNNKISEEFITNLQEKFYDHYKDRIDALEKRIQELEGGKLQEKENTMNVLEALRQISLHNSKNTNVVTPDNDNYSDALKRIKALNDAKKMESSTIEDKPQVTMLECLYPETYI